MSLDRNSRLNGAYAYFRSTSISPRQTIERQKTCGHQEILSLGAQDQVLTSIQGFIVHV